MVIELGGHTSKRESTQNLVEKQAISTCRELKRVQRQNVFLSNFQWKCWDCLKVLLWKEIWWWKILHRDIFVKDSNEFDGHFSENSQKEFVPASLKSFVGTVIQGNRMSK